MTLRICLDCTTAYAPDLHRCPHCRSERGQEQGTDPYRGDNMPKITRHGGPSDRHEHVPAGSAEQVEGSEQPSLGSSSETSTEKPQSSPETSETPLPKRARTTGSRSGKGRTASSTARSTGGSGEADAS